MARPPRTLLELCVIAAARRPDGRPSTALDQLRAIPQGTRVCGLIVEWAIARHELGRPLTAEEVAAWWKVSRATTYRRLAEFRELFEDAVGWTTPEPLAVELGRRFGGRVRERDLAGLMTVPPPLAA